LLFLCGLSELGGKSFLVAAMLLQVYGLNFRNIFFPLLPICATVPHFQYYLQFALKNQLFLLNISEAIPEVADSKD